VTKNKWQLSERIRETASFSIILTQFYKEPFMFINYVPHGGNHQVAIVFCPNICRRFLHLSRDASPGTGWVLRDYIRGQKLDHKQLLNAVDIEEEIHLSLDKNRVLNISCEERETWKKYMRQLSENFINVPDMGGAPQKFADSWESLE
jgi:hypothetical protein